MAKHRSGLSNSVNVRVSRWGRPIKQKKRTLNVTGADQEVKEAQIHARLGGEFSLEIYSDRSQLCTSTM
jgi:hypothetical protein